MQKQKELVVYYGDWDIYARSFFIANINPNIITTLVYSFVNVDASGNLVLADAYADTQCHFSTLGTYIGNPDSWNDNPPLPFYGNLNQLKKLKQSNNNLRLEIGIGGWTFSSNLSNAMSTTNQSNFINSIESFLKTYSFFDGIVIDWEYPSSKGNNYGNVGNVTNPQDPVNFLNTVALLSKITTVSACYSTQ
jgi:chitinase